MRILYIATISNTINAFMIPHIKMLVDQGHKVDVACNIQREIDKNLVELGCKVYNISFSRFPLKKSNIKAYQDLKTLIMDQKYDLVHTHTPVASAITRLVCRSIKETRVFYTAHGFHFYDGAPIKNWIIYYPMEKWLSKYTDTLITINKEDYERAKSSFKAKRIESLPGVGLDIDGLRNVTVDIDVKRKEVGVPQNSFVVLSVGELNENKNHEVVLRAIAKLNNPNIHYVICGRGPLESYLNNVSRELGVSKNVHLLGFRSDIPEICKISDVFVFPSFREGLSVALMEAMTNKLPVVCSNIRGNSDLIDDGNGGYLVEPSDSDRFARYINVLIVDSRLRSTFGEVNLKKIMSYSIENVLKEIKEIYFN